MVDLFNLEKKYADEMVAHAHGESPNECCGILAGGNGRVIKFYRTTNTERNHCRYKIELLGVYHSHTHTEAYPSPADIESTVLPGSIYFIISLSDPEQAVIRGFHLIEGKITEVELRITKSEL